MPGTSHFRAADLAAIFFAAGLAALFLATTLRSPQATPRHILVALGVTLIFALLAWLAHGVDLSGAFAGAAIAFILAAHDLRLFSVLLLIFALTLAATRLGSRRKQRLHTAEARTGRTASQVAANLGVAAVVVMMARANWSVLALAALAEVAADTSSSEVGLSFPGKTVLITTGRAVAPGVDGAISLHGTASALVAAGVIALASRGLGLVSTKQAAIVLYAGFLGSIIDSLLGALFERRGLLNNDAVNLLSTAASAGLAAIALR